MKGLRERYIEAGLTRKEFAKACGCSEPYIYGVEAHREKLSPQMEAIVEVVLAGGDASRMSRRTVSGTHGTYEVKPFKNDAQTKEMKAIWLEHFAGVFDGGE